MARILVSYYKSQEVEIQTPMYYFEAFTKELAVQGNQVFMINTAYFNTYQSNEVSSKYLNELLLEDARRFNPELIIAFNHRIPKSYLDSFDVPIVIWDGDAPGFLCDFDYIKKNMGRYKLFSISKNWYEEYMEMGFDPNDYIYMPNATSVRAETMAQTMNVSFLGTRLWTDQSIPNGMTKGFYQHQSKALVEEYLRSGNNDYDYYLNKYFNELVVVHGWKKNKIHPLMEYRWLVLGNMLDLGLTICGTHSRWEDVKEHMPQILACYDQRRAWTLEENNWFYNSSKVSLCPLHPQAEGKAFPWRAFDIMASNACLLIQKSSEFSELIKGHVNIPTFATPYEARDICKELLRDDLARQQIVKDSQKFIDNNARWPQRFAEAESVLAIPLLNVGKNGSVYDPIFDNEEIKSRIKYGKKYMEDFKVAVKNASSGSGKNKIIKKKWRKIQSLNTICKMIKIGGVSVGVGAFLNILANTVSDSKLVQFIQKNDIGSTAGKVLFFAGITVLIFSIVVIGIKAMLKVLRYIIGYKEKQEVSI